MYYYRDILKQLFEEFRDRHKEIRHNRAPLGSGVRRSYEISLLGGTDNLGLVYWYGEPERVSGHCRGLEIVSPHHTAVREPWFAEDESSSTMYRESIGKTHFRALVSLERVSFSTEQREAIRLSYELDPTIDGANQILLIHARLQELLKTATQFVSK